jgi:hypothetical protein
MRPGTDARILATVTRDLQIDGADGTERRFLVHEVVELHVEVIARLRGGTMARQAVPFVMRSQSVRPADLSAIASA